VARRKRAYERGSLGRAKSAFGDARGGTNGAANPNGSVNNIAGDIFRKLQCSGFDAASGKLIDPRVSGTDGSGLFESLAGDAKVA